MASTTDYGGLDDARCDSCNRKRDTTLIQIDGVEYELCPRCATDHRRRRCQ